MGKKKAKAATKPRTRPGKKKATVKARKTTAKRAPRPKQQKIGPDELEIIEREIIRGRPVAAIARDLKVHHSTVQQQVDTHLRPAWRAKLRRGAEIELAKIDHLEAIAWERMDQVEQAEDRETVTKELTKDGADAVLIKRMNMKLRRRNATGWVAAIEWCIEMRCKLLGHFAPTKVKVEEEGLRVAGKTIDEVDAEMMGRLMAKITERQRTRMALQRANLN